MTEKIDHAAKATEWVQEASRPDIPMDMTSALAEIAQVHATLALVEQQRVANMIALARPEVIDEAHDTKAWVSSWLVDRDEAGNITNVELRPEIAAALGIGDGDD